jgi:hypothetical protein
MTEQEKSIIETILVEVGLESLHAGGADEYESEDKPGIGQRIFNRSEYSGS